MTHSHLYSETFGTACGLRLNSERKKEMRDFLTQDPALTDCPYCRATFHGYIPPWRNKMEPRHRAEAVSWAKHMLRFQFMATPDPVC